MRFTRVFEHSFFGFVFRSCFFADVACAAILLFSGPKLEDLLLISGFYAGRAVLTAFVRVIRRFLLLFLYFRRVVCCFCTLAVHPCANHDNVI